MDHREKITLVHEPTCTRAEPNAERTWEVRKSQFSVGIELWFEAAIKRKKRLIFYFCCWTVRFRATYRESWKVVTAVTVEPGCKLSSGRKEGSR